MRYSTYAPPHRRRLRRTADRAAWRRALADEGALARLRERMVPAPPAPSQLSGASQFLKERNGPRVRALIRDGTTDPDTLLAALADWPAALDGAETFPLLFLGLVVTLGCSFAPRCLYCNQALVPSALSVSDWKTLIAEAAEPAHPYIYITGGEPLLLGEEVWGPDGLVAFAARRGCAVNINTNAALITPEAALGLAASGCSKLHISLDSADPQIAAEMLGSPERVEAVWRGIWNVQVAREALGVGTPQIHINCVLTRRNLFTFPSLLRALLEMRPLPPADTGDFAFHLIPVGGPDNAPIRPSAAEWKRFYTETWQEAEAVWAAYQADTGVAEGARTTLAAHVPYANPYARVDHHMGLDEYCELAGAGTYWQGALLDRCYLAPSQAYVLPDGSQHWCGGHAIRRPEPIGSVKGSGLRANIRAAAGRLALLPVDACASCAGATCVINQSMERGLREQVEAWLAEEPAPGRKA